MGRLPVRLSYLAADRDDEGREFGGAFLDDRIAIAPTASFHTTNKAIRTAESCLLKAPADATATGMRSGQRQ